MRDRRIRQNLTALTPVMLETSKLDARQPADLVGDAQWRERIDAIGDRDDLPPDQPGADSEAQQDRNGQSSDDDRNNPGAARRVGLIGLHRPVLEHRT